MYRGVCDLAFSCHKMRTQKTRSKQRWRPSNSCWKLIGWVWCESHSEVTARVSYWDWRDLGSNVHSAMKITVGLKWATTGHGTLYTEFTSQGCCENKTEESRATDWEDRCGFKRCRQVERKKTNHATRYRLALSAHRNPSFLVSNIYCQSKNICSSFLQLSGALATPNGLNCTIFPPMPKDDFYNQ